MAHLPSYEPLGLNTERTHTSALPPLCSPRNSGEHIKLRVPYRVFYVAQHSFPIRRTPQEASFRTHGADASNIRRTYGKLDVELRLQSFSIERLTRPSIVYVMLVICGPVLH